MASAADNRVCNFCNQPGHIAANCPKKRQQRIQRNPQSRFQGQYQPAYQPRAPPYQQRAPQPRQFELGGDQSPQFPPGGKNVVPNRPQFQPPAGVTPVRPPQPPMHQHVGGYSPEQQPSPMLQPLPPTGYYSQYPAAGHYSVPTFSQYPQTALLPRSGPGYGVNDRTVL